jgi:MFS family permease
LNRRLLAITFIRALLSLSFALSWPFVPLYLHDRGLSVFNVGVFLTFAVIFGAVLRFLMGNIGDMVDRVFLIRAVLSLRLFVLLLLALLIYLNSSLFLIFLAVFLVSASFSMFLPIADSYVADVSEDRVRGFSLTRIAINLGWALGTFLSSILIRFGYVFLFILSALVLIIALYESKHLKEVEKRGRDIRFRMVLPDGSFIVFSLITAFAFTLSAQLTSNLSLFAVEELRIQKNLIAYLFTLNGILNILFQMPLSKVLNRLGYNMSVMAGGLFFTLGFLTLLFSENYFHILLSVVFLTFGEMFMFPVLMASASNRAPSGELGAYVGFWSTFQGLGFSLGPAWGGFLLEGMGRGAWLVMSLQSALVSFFFTLNPERKCKVTV